MSDLLNTIHIRIVQQKRVSLLEHTRSLHWLWVIHISSDLPLTPAQVPGNKKGFDLFDKIGFFFTFLFFYLRRVDWAYMLFVSTDLLYSFCSHSFKLESFTTTSLYCWLLISSAGTRLKCLARGHLGSCWTVEGLLVSRWILNWRMQSSDVLKHSSHVVSERINHSQNNTPVKTLYLQYNG